MKMKYLYIPVIVLFLGSCATLPQTATHPELAEPSITATEQVEPANTSTTPPDPVTLSPTASPTPQPTPEATLSLTEPLSPPQPDEVSLEGITSFALLPDNIAQGEPAPDFSARLLGGEIFTLSENIGAYWLVLPTTIGCGECMFSLSMVTYAQPIEDNKLNVLVVDIVESNQPEYWEAYFGLFEGLETQWSVVNSSDFVVDYDIFGLGTFLVIDPQGNLVYRSNSPPRVEYIERMFTLADTQGGG